jgi:hypothetical protein
MAVRIFLGLSVLVWLPYGIWCVMQPGFLAGAAGVASSTPTGTTELRAMYGGLQAAIGALALCALLRPSLARPALVALVFLPAGLFLGRLAGLGLDGGVSSYTATALVFEAACALWAGWLLTRVPEPAAA